MQKLSNKLEEISRSKYPALMTHVVLGYPSLEESIALTLVMVDAGVSIVELQLPFSDPMADGPSIMYANEVAVENGVSTRDCMKAMERLSRKVEVPLLFMSYYNLLHSYPAGLDAFLKDARQAGAEGLIVPDISPDCRRDDFFNKSLVQRLAPIPLVSPLTSRERMKKIAKIHSEGFVYCVSTTGTTGARKDLPAGLKKYLAEVKQEFKQPRAVGFGISKPEHIRALKGSAEIAVVGSASIDLLRGESKKSERQKKIVKFVESLVF